MKNALNIKAFEMFSTVSEILTTRSKTAQIFYHVNEKPVHM